MPAWTPPRLHAYKILILACLAFWVQLGPVRFGTRVVGNAGS